MYMKHVNTQTIRHMQTLHSILICEEHNILTHCVPVMVKCHNSAGWQELEEIVNSTWGGFFGNSSHASGLPTVSVIRPLTAQKSCV